MIQLILSPLTDKVLSNSNIVLIGDSSGSTNRVLLANAEYVTVSGTAHRSVKIAVNKEDNSLNLTFLNNTISPSFTRKDYDVRSSIVILSASNNAIYVDMDSGLVLK